MERIMLYNDIALRWKNKDGDIRCLRVEMEEYPSNPRDDDHTAVMACWHKRYYLGDSVSETDPDDFWRNLVRKNVSSDEILAVAEAGKLPGIRIAKCKSKDDMVEIYNTDYYLSVSSETASRKLGYEEISREAVGTYLTEMLTVQQCMVLMEPYAAWEPIWLYDHSGITISCGERAGCFCDRWDSGQVGWVVILKKDLLADFENGYPVREDTDAGFSYKMVPITDENWLDFAKTQMKTEVNTYDFYLTGRSYVGTLYRFNKDHDEYAWDEIDQFDFYGDSTDALIDVVGDGFPEALKAGEVDAGEVDMENGLEFVFEGKAS